MKKHRVVIVGGGFGGLHAARALKNAPVEVTLLDRRNYHLFQPLLYQVATGGLSPGEIAAPLRAIFRKQKNVQVLMTSVTGFNLDAKRVETELGPIPYDSLVMAAGSKSWYFGKDEWSEVAPSIKNIEDATKLRARMFTAFEEAEKESDPEKRRAWLTFLLVGGGPTGVELAGALGELANETLKEDFRNIRPEEARILILDAGARILSNFSETLGRAAERQLIDLGVRCRTKVRVLDVTAEGAKLKTAEGAEEFIAARTVIWAAGVTTSPLAAALAEAAGVKLEQGARVLVQVDCTLPGYPEVFVIGDMAFFQHGLARALPGVCQPAMQMGDYAGALIAARLEGKTKPDFKYWDKGNMAVIGRNKAIAQVGKFEFSGYIAWLLWLFIHIMYLVSFQSRVIVAIRWGFDYFSFNRGARLITTGLKPHSPPASPKP